MNTTRPLYPFSLACIAGLLLIGCAVARSGGSVADIDRFAPPARVLAQTQAIVWVQPARQQLNPGDAAVVEIQIDNVTNLTAADIRLQFNPAVLQVQDSDPDQEGVQIRPGDFLSPDLVVRNVATNTLGVVHYALVQLPPSEPASGNGILATLDFLAVTTGLSQLNLTAELADNTGQLIPAAFESSQITVEQETDLPTPTLTLLPGQPTATPTATTPAGTPAVTLTSTPQTPTPTLTSTLPPTASSTATLTPLPPPTSTLVPPPANTPIPSVTEIPAGATCGFCYRVQASETLAGIGQKFGVDSYAIQIANDLYPPGHVYPQQALFIPTQMGQGPNVYVVQRYDTLASIADRCHLPVDFLAWVNHLDQAAILQAGHVLEIPLPPFPPPARYPYPPAGAPSVFPPPRR